MKTWLRCGPPKVRLSTISGTCSLPSRVPSGWMQCSPSPAAAQIRPSVSSRMPSKVPVSQRANTSPPVGQAGAVLGHGEQPDMPFLAVDDVQAPLVGRERQPVGPVEVAGHDAESAGARIDPVHVAGADLALRLVSFVVAVDAVGGVREPDRAVPTSPRPL